MAIWTAEIKELEKLYESFKGQLPDLEKELERLIKADDENMILLYSRRCLEVIITDLCECELKRPRKTEPLKGIIDKLHREGKVPSHIIASMHGLNELSTYGAHPKDFDPEQVKPVLVNLDIIIKWYLKYKCADIIYEEKPEDVKVNVLQPELSVEGNPKPNRNLALIFTAIILIIALIVFPKIFKRSNLESLRSSGKRISVAVMPFQNMTNDTNWDAWQDGVQDMLITSLSNSGELRVRQAESITSMIQSGGYTNYASITPSVARTISQKLDAHVFICGSINRAGTTIRFNAQLIDTNSDEVFKAFQIDGSAEKILQILDSLALEVKNFLIISSLKKEVSPDDYQLFVTTNSPEAYSLFLLGNKAYRNADYFSSYKIYLQALAIDSTFFEAALKLSVAYFNEYLYDEAKRWCLMAYKKRDQMPLQLKIITNRVYAILFETPIEEIKYLRQLQELDDLVPGYYYSSGYAYSQLFQFEKAIPEYEKALEIYDKSGIKPSWSFNYEQLGEAYNKTGQYKKEKKLYKKAEKDFPDNLGLTYRKWLLATVEGDTVNANKYLEKGIRIAKENSWTEANIAAQIAFGLSDIGEKDKAEEYYRKALSLEPDEPGRMNDLAFLLIDGESNITEGINLVDKALELKPDNYLFLHTKGWGLYKQGKYAEALNMLQKSWDLRREKAVYDQQAYLHLEAAKKAVANQKNN